jgi:hypothetical protein
MGIDPDPTNQGESEEEEENHSIPGLGGGDIPIAPLELIHLGFTLGTIDNDLLGIFGLIHGYSITTM